MSAHWPARGAAFLGWSAVAASAVYWLLRTTVSAPGLPPDALPVSGAAAVRGDVARLFAVETRAAAVAEPALASRFKLLGVVAPKGGEGGVALIAVDGKPPRAVRVGNSVDGEWLLQTVAARSASIGAQGAPAAVELTLPPPTPAATGSLPPVTPPQAVVPPPPPAPVAPTVAPPVPQGAQPPGIQPPTAVMPAVPRNPGGVRNRGESASTAR